MAKSRWDFLFCIKKINSDEKTLSEFIFFILKIFPKLMRRMKKLKIWNPKSKIWKKTLKILRRKTNLKILSVTNKWAKKFSKSNRRQFTARKWRLKLTDCRKWILRPPKTLTIYFEEWGGDFDWHKSYENNFLGEGRDFFLRKKYFYEKSWQRLQNLNAKEKLLSKAI